MTVSGEEQALPGLAPEVASVGSGAGRPPGARRAASPGRTETGRRTAGTAPADRNGRPAGGREPAPAAPVARVAVDIPLTHLDRPFDYLVPAALAAVAVPGCRVRVRFGGQLVDGFLLERVDASQHAGRLAYLEKVVSAEPVLRPEIVRLARAVADRYAGSLADVLRLAVPARHARAEKTPPTAPPPSDAAAQSAAPSSDAAQSAAPPSGAAAPPAAPGGAAVPEHEGVATAWSAYPAGPAYLAAVADGRPARAVWSALPGEDWPARLAEVAAAALRGGRGALLVVPDARDLDRLDAALAAALGTGRHVALSAALGPQERYRRYLAAARAEVTVVAGTRAAGFAPVSDLGVVMIFDDGDDAHAEPRAPYPHAREVLLTRAQQTGCAALVGGYARTAEAQLLLDTGWARGIVADRATVRRRAPAVSPVGDDPELARDPAAGTARLPSLAWRAARSALAADAPVLIQVPRRGYLPSTSCAQCQTAARCPSCSGPLALASSSQPPSCRWCGRTAAAYACPRCGGRRLRAAVVGARRTAEELGRAFPGVPVRTSGREAVLAGVPAEAALVVSTPGAEPVAADGYGAVLLLDTWALLNRADLRAGEEALRRWMAAAALARPAHRGGAVVIVADGGLLPVQALLRWDAAWLAARELAERRELGFPPAVRMASVTGSPEAVAELLAAARLPAGTDLLGPVPAGGDAERMLLRVPRGDGPGLAVALHAAAGVRAARKAEQPVRIQVDPLELW